MTLRNLQVFLAIAECGSMTKAAEKLFISQPSVSLAISEIEKTYNVTLFERLPSGMKLTPTGERLKTYAEKLLNLEQEMESFLTHESCSYCIRIGATITIGGSVISPLIAEMKKAKPKTDYHVMIGNTHYIESLLNEGELDIALVEGEINSPFLEVKRFISDRLVMICSNESPFSERSEVSIKELSDIPLIMREPMSGTREQFERAAKRSGINTIIRWSSSSYGAIIDAVQHNLGVGIISEHLVRKMVSAGMVHMCEITDANLKRDFKLVYRKDKYITDILAEIIDICKKGTVLDETLEL